MDKLENMFESLKNEYRELKAEVSEFRKKGFDTTIVNLKLMNIPSKIQLAESTREYRDIEKVKMMLNNIKSEISDIKSERDLNKEAEGTQNL
jgi:predicted  nucleic acid-binding Zn-ribbon protein